MSPASEPAPPKMFDAATFEDQEGIADGTHGEPVVVGPPAFSSNRPHTDSIKSLAELDDGERITHQVAAERAATDREAQDDSKLSAAEWKKQVESARSQEELDAVAQRYADSGKASSSVERAIDAKQADLNAQAGQQASE